MFKRLLAALLLLAACGGGAGGGAGPKPVPAPLVGYGLIHGWARLTPPDADAFGAALQAARLGLTEISWAPWLGHPSPCGAASSATYPVQASMFIAAMRKHGVVVEVELTNGNNCDAMAKPDAYILQALADLAAIGPQSIILNGVAEPWRGAQGAHWLGLVRLRWTGPFVMPAMHGVEPFAPSMLYDYVEPHPCQQSLVPGLLGLANPAVLTSTDCGPVLNPGAAKAHEWAEQARSLGVPLLIYDHRAIVPDYAVIAAMSPDA